MGIPVTLTRNSDETISPKERVSRVLNAYGNNSNVIVLSNHINAGGGDGAEVVYALRNDETLAKNILNEISKEGQNIRGYYQRRLPSDPSKDYYFILRETGKTQPVLIEYGFIDSPKDDVAQLQNNLLDYGEAVVRAVANYIGVPYTSGVPEKNVYVVKKGDSLYSIAAKYGVSVDSLKNSNNLTGNLLQIGQTLIIPEKESITPGDYEIYTVKKNDNLWDIANYYGVSVNDLINLNNLGTTMLQIGQQLLIPKKETTLDNIYIVKKGDSLWSIANQYGISVNELKSANNLSSNILTTGQELIIPKKENDSVSDDKITYIVQSGDSLWSIAKKYNISVNELKSANNLSNNLLQIGQKLIIPSEVDYIYYTVKSGDSLWKIANNYGVNVNDLIKVNNLTNDILSIGQVLLIPKK